MNAKLMFKQLLRALRSDKKIFLFLFLFLTLVFSLVLGLVSFLNTVKENTYDLYLKSEIKQPVTVKTEKMTLAGTKDSSKYEFSEKITDTIIELWNNNIKEEYSRLKKISQKVFVSDVPILIDRQSKDYQDVINELKTYNNHLNTFSKKDLTTLSNSEKYLFELKATHFNTDGDVIIRELSNIVTKDVTNVKYRVDTSMELNVKHNGVKLENLKFMGYDLYNQSDDFLSNVTYHKKMINDQNLLPIYVSEADLDKGMYNIGDAIDIAIDPMVTNAGYVNFKGQIVGTASPLNHLLKGGMTYLAFDNDEWNEYLSQNRNVDVINMNLGSVQDPISIWNVEGTHSLQYTDLFIESIEVLMDQGFWKLFSSDIDPYSMLDMNVDENGVYYNTYNILRIIIFSMGLLTILLSVFVLGFMVKELIEAQKKTLYFLNCMGVRNSKLSIMNTLNILPIILISLFVSFLGMIVVKMILINCLSNQYKFIMEGFELNWIMVWYYLVVFVFAILMFFLINYVIFKRGILDPNKNKGLPIGERIMIKFSPLFGKIFKNGTVGWSFVVKNISKNFIVLIALSITFGILLFGSQFSASFNANKTAPLRLLEPYKSVSGSEMNLFIGSQDDIDSNSMDEKNIDILSSENSPNETMDDHKDKEIIITKSKLLGSKISVSGGWIDNILKKLNIPNIESYDNVPELSREDFEGVYIKKDSTKQLDIKTCYGVDFWKGGGIEIAGHQLPEDDPEGTFLPEKVIEVILSILNQLCNVNSSLESTYNGYDEGIDISLYKTYKTNTDVKGFTRWNTDAPLFDGKNTKLTPNTFNSIDMNFFNIIDSISKKISYEDVTLNKSDIDLFTLSWLLKQLPSLSKLNNDEKFTIKVPVLNVIAGGMMANYVHKIGVMPLSLSSFNISPNNNGDSPIKNIDKGLIMPLFFRIQEVRPELIYGNDIFADNVATMNYIQNAMNSLDYLHKEDKEVSNIGLTFNKRVLKVTKLMADKLNDFIDYNKTQSVDLYTKMQNAFFSADSMPYLAKYVTIGVDGYKDDIPLPDEGQMSKIYIMDFNLFEKMFELKMGDYKKIFNSVNAITLIVAVMLSMLMIELILTENKKNILLFKATGYGKREILLFMGVGYIITTVIAILIGVGISYGLLTFLSGVMASNVGMIMTFTISADYLVFALGLPIAFATAILCSILIFARQLKPSQAFGAL